MIYSRHLVSDTHRFSIPLRWLGDLARRALPFSPAGQENHKGRHTAEYLEALRINRKLQRIADYLNTPDGRARFKALVLAELDAP